MDLFEVANPLLARGKRLRAGFLAAGWRSYGGQPMAAAEIQAGAGLELFQLAALVHDDLIDASPTRRGLASAHRQFHSLHGRNRMISDGNTFGAAGALLLGDLLLVAAESELQAALAAIPGNANRARVVFEKMMAEVTAGQYLDIYAQSAPWSDNPDVDLDRAKRVIRAKSARYSVEHPLALGACMAGANYEEEEAIREVGSPVGEAFQLRDDVLSVFGDPKQTGKPSGDDLREGKRTVLVTLAMVRASGSEAKFLKEKIGDPSLNDRDIAKIKEILVNCGALAEVESLIDARAAAATTAMERLDLDADAEAFLKTLTSAAITRVQ